MNEPVPRVSVIIPAYYSSGTVAACLEALRRQTFQDFETILINSSPEEETQRIVAGGFPEVRFEQSPVRLYPHAARNRGVCLARGSLLVFTDPDCAADSNWLARLLAAHEQGHPVIAGSMGLGDSGWLAKGIHLCKFFWLLPGLLPGPCEIAPTANVCYSRQAWDAIGPLDPDTFIADAVQSWRAAAHGWRPWFEPQAVVYHWHDETLSGLWRQRRRRGREFLRDRAKFKRWGAVHTGLYLGLCFLLPLLVLARASLAAWKSGWFGPFLLTLPVQWVGHQAWSLGEARASWDLLASGSRLRKETL